MQQDNSLALTIAGIARLRVRAAAAGGPSLMAALLFLVALALRLDFDAAASGDPFAVFHVALMVTALACGWRRAIVSAAAAAAAEWFFYLRASPPTDEGGGAAMLAVALASFVVVATVEIALAEILAQAAAACQRAKMANDPHRLASRRALTAARFVAAPVVDAASPSAAADIESVRIVRTRLELIERLSNEAAGSGRASEAWAERMEAMCQAPGSRPLEMAPLIRISGAGEGLSPDRLLAISLAVLEMLREATEAGCEMFEATLLGPAADGCALDVRSAGGRLSRIDRTGAAPWPTATHWLARMLGARVIVSTDGDPGVRFHFAT